MAAPRKATIARIWRGRVRRERADEYEKYNYEVGIKPLIEKALGVQCLREDRDGESEFVTISYWATVESMAAFTGADPTAIHHLPRDPEFLVELPKSVQILKIRHSHGERGWLQERGPAARFVLQLASPFIWGGAPRIAGRRGHEHQSRYS